jgi:hypothetical protein
MSTKQKYKVFVNNKLAFSSNNFQHFLLAVDEFENNSAYTMDHSDSDDEVYFTIPA